MSTSRLAWPDRPRSRAQNLETRPEIRGQNARQLAICAKLKENDCGATVLTSLCDIAWLYNLRGSDVEDTPVFMSFCIVTENSDVLYIQKTALFSDRTEYEADGVTIRDYNDFWEDLKKLDKKTLVDKTAVSAAVMETLGDKAFWAANPTILMKSKKNPTELENLRKCHVADGLAVTKFMGPIRHYNNIDEYKVGKIVYSLRKECADELGCTIIGESFGTIAAFGANAAMMHYSAASEGSAKIDPKAEVPMLLVDSGGQYLEGTTDITRTFLLGEVSDEIKRNYTLTACGMLRLLNAVFLSGATGSALADMRRRSRCGRSGLITARNWHGVGYPPSVHGVRTASITAAARCSRRA
ncbi:MAG: aminopeptidase P family N-terminal domain-containing protein [Eubacteriales bacterium]